MKVGQSVAEIPRFFDFQDGGGRHLGFSKIRNFNDLSPTGANMRHIAKFHRNWSPHQTVAEIWRFNFLPKWQLSGPPSWICWVQIWTTRDEHLVVFSVVQSLVGIDTVVLIICRFQYFAR